jgi:antitoxin component YwqK of YwqJK toxin-antitoxin module
MSKNIFKLLFFIIPLAACMNEETSKKLVVIKYKSGKIKSESNYINDSIRDGLTKLYYEDGVLSDEINFRNGLQDGWWLQYSQAGVLQSKIMFVKGIKNGPAYFYYENGNLEHKEYWRYGKIFGGSYWYYRNGHLENYTSFDFEGNKRYKVEFDSTGEKTRDEGDIIGQISSNSVYDREKKVLDSVFVGKSFYGEVSIATPPNTIIKVFMCETEYSKMIDCNEMQIRDDLVTFQKVFSQKGNHILSFVGEMRDSSTLRLLKRDSAILNIIDR